MSTVDNIEKDLHALSVSGSTTTKTSTPATTTTTTTERIAPHTMPPLEDTHLLKYIVSFVGTNQYRFVTAVNRNFQAVYRSLYPDNKRTYYNASTVGHATICFNELQVVLVPQLKEKVLGPNCTLTTVEPARKAYDVRGQIKLCELAASCGNVSVLQYLQSVASYHSSAILCVQLRPRMVT
jgi:hypothetical protein